MEQQNNKMMKKIKISLIYLFKILLIYLKILLIFLLIKYC